MTVTKITTKGKYGGYPFLTTRYAKNVVDGYDGGVGSVCTATVHGIADGRFSGSWTRLKKKSSKVLITKTLIYNETNVI